jgi:hypothetical protein
LPHGQEQSRAAPQKSSPYPKKKAVAKPRKVQQVQQSNKQNPIKRFKMQTKSNNGVVAVQHATDLAQQSNTEYPQNTEFAQQYDTETPFFKHNAVDMYSKSQNAIHIPNQNQHLDIAPEVLDNGSEVLDIAPSFPVAPLVELVELDKRAQFISELTATQSQLKTIEGYKTENEKARNSAQTQIARFEKWIKLTNDLQKIAEYNSKMNNISQTKQRLATEYKSLCAQLKSLQATENQLQRKIQSLDTPIEIGGNNG